MHVDFETSRRGRDVVDYSVVLVVKHEARTDTVRVYDGAHGMNELHRHTRVSGKQAAEIFARGTLGEGMRAAIAAVECGYDEMIEGWERA